MQSTGAAPSSPSLPSWRAHIRSLMLDHDQQHDEQHEQHEQHDQHDQHDQQQQQQHEQQQEADDTITRLESAEQTSQGENARSASIVVIQDRAKLPSDSLLCRLDEESADRAASSSAASSTAPELAVSSSSSSSSSATGRAPSFRQSQTGQLQEAKRERCQRRRQQRRDYLANLGLWPLRSCGTQTSSRPCRWDSVGGRQQHPIASLAQFQGRHDAMVNARKTASLSNLTPAKIRDVPLGTWAIVRGQKTMVRHISDSNLFVPIRRKSVGVGSTAQMPHGYNDDTGHDNSEGNYGDANHANHANHQNHDGHENNQTHDGRGIQRPDSIPGGAAAMGRPERGRQQWCGARHWGESTSDVRNGVKAYARGGWRWEQQQQRQQQRLQRQRQREQELQWEQRQQQDHEPEQRRSDSGTQQKRQQRRQWWHPRRKPSPNDTFFPTLANEFDDKVTLETTDEELSDGSTQSLSYTDESPKSAAPSKALDSCDVW